MTISLPRQTLRPNAQASDGPVQLTEAQSAPSQAEVEAFTSARTAPTTQQTSIISSEAVSRSSKPSLPHHGRRGEAVIRHMQSSTEGDPCGSPDVSPMLGYEHTPHTIRLLDEDEKDGVQIPGQHGHAAKYDHHQHAGVSSN